MDLCLKLIIERPIVPILGYVVNTKPGIRTALQDDYRSQHEGPQQNVGGAGHTHGIREARVEG